MTDILLGIIAIVLWLIWGQLIIIKLLITCESKAADNLLPGEITKISHKTSFFWYLFGIVSALMVTGHLAWHYLNI